MKLSVLFLSLVSSILIGQAFAGGTDVIVAIKNNTEREAVVYIKASGSDKYGKYEGEATSPRKLAPGEVWVVLEQDINSEYAGSVRPLSFIVEMPAGLSTIKTQTYRGQYSQQAPLLLTSLEAEDLDYEARRDAILYRNKNRK